MSIANGHLSVGTGSVTHTRTFEQCPSHPVQNFRQWLGTSKKSKLFLNTQTTAYTRTLTLLQPPPPPPGRPFTDYSTEHT